MLDRRLRAPLLLLTLPLVLGGQGCQRPEVTGGDPPREIAPFARPVQMPAAPARPIRKGWIGVVVARESVDVTAEAPGRLQGVHVQIGDRVRRGDPIASLDTRLITQDLEMARSGLRASEADERRASDELAEAKARNDRRQANPDFFSKEDLAEVALQAKTFAAALDVARARVGEQRARVRQLEASLASNVIRAPFEGRVAERFVDPGAQIAPGSPIVRLISAGDLLVRAAVPPEEARALSVGSQVTATIRNLNLAVPGTIERIAPEVDAASQMVLIEIRLAPGQEAVDGRLQTGLVVDVSRRA